MMTFKMVVVSPELAAEWLKRNRKNRPINATHVAKLVRDMNLEACEEHPTATVEVCR